MPEMTVKAFAELMHTPLYGQWRILRDQKYPKQVPAAFRIPYYRPALRTIQRYYDHDNDPSTLPNTAHSIPGVTTAPGNAENNLRAIQAFRSGSQAVRQLSITPSNTFGHLINTVGIRATADFTATEGNSQQPRYLIYNLRESRPENEVIRTTVELFHFVLHQNGMTAPLGSIEYVHLQDDEVFRWTGQRRQLTIQRAQVTAQAIAAMWDSI